MNVAPWQLVIFDNDGVIVDSEPLAAAAMSEVLLAWGEPMSASDCEEQLRGNTLERDRQVIEARTGRQLPADFEDRYMARLLELLATDLRPVPGIGAVLDLLESAGIPYCLASSGRRERISFALQTVGLAARFAGRWWGAEDVAEGKPAPDLFLLAARSLGVAPKDCVVVEDAEVGVRAARAAGMAVLGFAARTPAERLSAADHVFSDMAQLPPLLLGGPASAS